ncbi:hypothetical protein RRG08_003253 [Elysia crispata]|uniref:Uncharacterized protein n=1 Tax=Elysia crispata TaxID=231223 RepID=A0AAE1AZ45_9GAST|nr:hypothetical protein RRG08_003253 [Elysia crispata]
MITTVKSDKKTVVSLETNPKTGFSQRAQRMAPLAAATAKKSEGIFRPMKSALKGLLFDCVSNSMGRVPALSRARRAGRNHLSMFETYTSIG